jgi:hypothetical protein
VTPARVRRLIGIYAWQRLDLVEQVSVREDAPRIRRLDVGSRRALLLYLVLAHDRGYISEEVVR